MSAYRAALLALFVVGASIAALPASAAGEAPASGGPSDGASAGPSDGASAAPGDPTAADAPSAAGHSATGAGGSAGVLDQSANNSTADGSAFGADISSFMQSSAAEVEGTVETGMWTAAYNDTDNRTVRVRLVQRRTGDLREQLADLRGHKQALLAEREAGNLTDAAFKARLARLIGEINALRAAIDATESRAREVNAGVAAVAGLRNETADLTGPAVAAAARDLAGVGNVGNGGVGPPGGVGDGNGNGDGVGVGDGTDDSDGVGAGDGNGQDVGTGDEDTDSDGRDAGTGDRNGKDGGTGDDGDGVGGGDGSGDSGGRSVDGAGTGTTGNETTSDGTAGAPNAWAEVGPDGAFVDAPTDHTTPATGLREAVDVVTGVLDVHW